jgi:chemotaxis response regulator CheB
MDDAVDRRRGGFRGGVSKERLRAGVPLHDAAAGRLNQDGGEAADDAEARALVERLRPDVVVLDAQMRGLDVHAAALVFRGLSPNTAVVIHALDPDALSDDGMTRVVGKHEDLAALLAAIRVEAGDRGR